MLGPTFLLASALTSAHLSARRTASRSGLPASWGLILTLGWPRGAPHKETAAERQGSGDASNADPVCSKSEHHGVILAAREEAEHATQTIEQLAFRNERNSRLIAKG